MINSDLRPTKIFKQKGIQFVVNKTTSSNFESEEFSIEPASPQNCIIPNQLWRGYQNQQSFNNEQARAGNIISNKTFKNFGVSVSNYGCAICCSIAAINYLKSANYTIYDLYNKNAFTWKQSFNKNGVPNGATLMNFKATKRWGVDTTQTLQIAYDVGRDYGWCKKSSRYSGTSSIIDASHVSAWKSQFYYPQTDETADGYKPPIGDDYNVYNQAGGRYQRGSLDAIFSESSLYALQYRAAQAQALYRIKQDISNGFVDILYINSGSNKSGHYVLAVGYSQQHSGYYGYQDVIVWDPCPTKTNGFDNKNSYYGRQITLMEAMSRIKADISDGIRTIQTCSVIT